MLSEQEIQSIIDRYLTGTLDPEGKEQFRKLLEDPAYDAMLEAVIDHQFALRLSEKYEFPETQHRMKDFVFKNMQVTERVIPVHRVHFLRTAWFRYAVAVIVLMGTGVYFWNSTRNNQASLAGSTHAGINQGTDKVPGTNKATLTLADGSVVELDAAGNGALAQQGNAHIIKLDGQLVYKMDPKEPSVKEPGFNIISTPKGGQYQIVLPDGTHVWLNAASSVKFPASFTSGTRTVEIAGEAYFEVTGDKKLPFFVNVNGAQVAVLGTSFNINAYSDEPTAKITLQEGSVKVNYNDRSTLLKPGQQLSVSSSEYVIKQVNTAEVLAWKNGLFNFKNAGLKAVMRQLSRWYDVDIKYAAQVPDRNFSGELERNLTLNQVLEVLGDLEVHFKTEGRTLIVMP